MDTISDLIKDMYKLEGPISLASKLRGEIISENRWRRERINIRNKIFHTFNVLLSPAHFNALETLKELSIYVDHERGLLNKQIAARHRMSRERARQIKEKCKTYIQQEIWLHPD